MQNDKILKISELRERISDIGKEVSKTHTRYEVELNRIPMFGIVPIEDLKRLQEMDRRLEEDLNFIDNVRSHFTDVSENDLEQEIVKNLAEVRKEMREEQQHK
jgi:Antitoxin Phd_YefM, type II toxin-antitoxin system